MGEPRGEPQAVTCKRNKGKGAWEPRAKARRRAFGWRQVRGVPGKHPAPGWPWSAKDSPLKICFWWMLALKPYWEHEQSMSKLYRNEVGTSARRPAPSIMVLRCSDEQEMQGRTHCLKFILYPVWLPSHTEWSSTLGHLIDHHLKFLAIFPLSHNHMVGVI